MSAPVCGEVASLCSREDRTSRTTPRHPLRRAWALAAVLLGGVTSSTWAQSHDPSVFAQAGQGDRAVRAVAVGATGSFLPVDPAEATPWSFYGEVVLGEWFTHHHESGQRTSFLQLTAAPVARYTFAGFGGASGGLFVELGVGVSLIAPHFEDYGRRFSSVFNFDDHTALGMRFGARRENELSMRVEHFSNGGIRQPNPGQNLVQLRYARHF